MIENQDSLWPERFFFPTQPHPPAVADPHGDAAVPPPPSDEDCEQRLFRPDDDYQWMVLL